MHRANLTKQQEFTILRHEILIRVIPFIIVKFNKEIGRLRILSSACSMKYSKQVVFDAMLLLLLQKSVIDIDDD